ncbi:MAG: 6-carboxytetrahydropterin synthase [Bacteroidota bacterium]
MARIRLTKSFNFEGSHALLNYDGKCRNIHGHSYKLDVTVIGTPFNEKGHPKDGLLIDFGDLKEIVNQQIVDQFDHSLIIQKEYPATLFEALENSFERLIYVDYQPTCENLIVDFADKLVNTLPEGVELHHLVLHETATAYCEWFASDQ